MDRKDLILAIVWKKRRSWKLRDIQDLTVGLYNDHLSMIVSHDRHIQLCIIGTAVEMYSKTAYNCQEVKYKGLKRRAEGQKKSPEVELVNIGAADIVDGNHKLILGLIWSIILHWQVKDVMKDVMAGLQQTNSEKILLSWVRQNTRQYPQMLTLAIWERKDVFNLKWKPVLGRQCVGVTLHSRVGALISIISVLRSTWLTSPVAGMMDWPSMPSSTATDVAVPHPDKKSVIMYVTSLFQVLPQSVSMEAIKEVETLPRGAVASAARVTTEEHYQIQTQQRFSQQRREKWGENCLPVNVFVCFRNLGDKSRTKETTLKISSSTDTDVSTAVFFNLSVRSMSYHTAVNRSEVPGISSGPARRCVSLSSALAGHLILWILLSSEMPDASRSPLVPCLDWRRCFSHQSSIGSESTPQKNLTAEQENMGQKLTHEIHITE
ncbi:Dystrophin [Collichthys lucidus]|uniref:Dystrophin n=1 Tax=Collichthys lucidus TaxID=240159 RepID=A0A4U5TY24_COLLU|nr:Dystrophin [Collichthys lucidus]